MNKLQKAIAIAVEAHTGQIDKGGQAYINHPIYLALLMENEEEKIVALLHDVMEDSKKYDSEEIKVIFGDRIWKALDCLTHRIDMDYFDYIEHIKNNEIAKKVKLADLSHNSDITRLSTFTEKDRERLGRYKKAISMLKDQK